MPEITVKLDRQELYLIIRREIERKFNRTVKSMIFNVSVENLSDPFDNVEVKLGDELDPRHSRYYR